MSDLPDTNNIEEVFTKKIAGLPGWAWVAITVGGAYAYKKYKGGAVSATSSQASPDSSVLSGDTSVTDTPAATNSATDAYGNPVVMGANGTNATWAQSASDYLLASSSYSPSDIENALSNYQSGNALTPVQTTIVDSILHTFGTPPDGIIPLNTGGTDTNPAPNTSAPNTPAPNTPAPNTPAPQPLPPSPSPAPAPSQAVPTPVQSNIGTNRSISLAGTSRAGD